MFEYQQWVLNTVNRDSMRKQIAYNAIGYNLSVGLSIVGDLISLRIISLAVAA